jgi:Tfp pilus assembly protein PilW
MKIIKIKNSGFTFIETLIYIMIISTVVVAFVSYSVSVPKAKSKTYVIQEAQANGRLAIDVVSQKIRAAIGINNGTSTFGSDPGVLSLAMADSSKNPTIIDLSQDDGALRIKEGTGDPVNITTARIKIKNLVFYNLTPSNGNGVINVRLTLEYNNPSGAKEYSYSQTLETTVSLRQ